VSAPPDFAALERCREWIGRTEDRRDVATAAPLASLWALLDREDAPPREGEPAPALAHWLYFLPNYRQSDAGEDGHVAHGGLIPSMPLPRRMWAGSRLEFPRPLIVGSRISRRSRIQDVKVKSGKSGALVFVLVRHEVSDDRGIVIVDEHDIVFRAPGTPGEGGLDAPATAAWTREIRPDPLLLFRYSAVTFNGHRIHYDHPYVTQAEGYPGLVVHGPLIATLLVDLLSRNVPGARLTHYAFRALAPLYDTAPFTTCGEPGESPQSARLWTRDAHGHRTFEATARW
jgi:3-methylfumaryl-CoA hydratase